MRAAASVGLGILLVGGCVTEGVPDLPPDPQPPEEQARPLVPDANGCAEVATLDGLQGDSRTFGPYLFGTGTFCLRLDASQNRRAHFMANTRNELGTVSGFTIAMTAPDGTPLESGADVTVGLTDPKTFASLERAIDAGTVLDVRLVVSAADKATAVHVALFDPLE